MFIGNRSIKLLLILAFVFFFGFSLQHVSAGTKESNGITFTWPNDVEACEPTSDTITASGIPADHLARIEVLQQFNDGTSVILASTGDMAPDSSGMVHFEFNYPPSDSWPVVDGQAVLDLSARVRVWNSDGTLATLGGKWKVTCTKDEATPTATPPEDEPTPTSTPPKDDPTPTATAPKDDPTPTPTATPTEPPQGGEGCTPGYWRQPHHFDSWVGYAPDQTFDAVFGVTSGFGPGATLLDVVWAGGGGENAMGRHAVAALLNATSDVSYGYSESEVISMVQNAYSSGEFESVKDQFETQNELGCPLD